MGIKKLKPTTPGLRGRHLPDFSKLSRRRGEKRLMRGLKGSGGRNNLGRMTAHHRGGANKRRYRIVDYKRDKMGIPAKVVSIEYDPCRTARIALLHYMDGEKRYILAPAQLNVGDMVLSGEEVEIKVGNALPLRCVPEGTIIHNIEMKPKKGGQIVRSGGTGAQLLAKEGKYAQIKMPSNEIRLIDLNCMATIGQLSNIDNQNISWGKAGKSRWMGIRPRVRGVAMNPVDHPLGGGEGKSSGGRHPCTPWGTPTKGYKTRRNVRSDKYIVKRRK